MQGRAADVITKALLAPTALPPCSRHMATATDQSTTSGVAASFVDAQPWSHR